MLKGIHLTLLMGPVAVSPVPQEVIEALTSVQITVSAGQRSGFQLSFGLGSRSPLHGKILPSGFFDPPMRVILVVTFNGIQHVLMDGVITQHEISPSNDPGQSTLTITGEDLSRLMDFIDLSGIPYPAMPLEARVAFILARYAMFGVTPMIIPSVLVYVQNPVKVIPSHEGTDLQYIEQLAQDVGYVFYLDPGPRPGMNIGYWGPEIKIGAPQPALSINMGAHTNVESLSFSFDGLSKTQFILHIQNEESKISVPIPVPDITPLNPPLGGKPVFPVKLEMIKEGTAKHAIPKAAARALAKASASADVISGSGQLNVLRYGHILKARQLVGVRGAGADYNGLYYVKSVTHNIKPGEYTQSFTLSRNARSSLTSTIPV